MPVEDFYVDFARASFGDSVAVRAGKLLARMDGVHMPQASDWKNGPGNLVANPKPWSEEGPRYAFVGELAALRSLVKGPGNTERFDYWLTTWRAMAAMAEVSCLRGQLDAAMAAKKYDDALTNRLELAGEMGKLVCEKGRLFLSRNERSMLEHLREAPGAWDSSQDAAPAVRRA